LKPDNHMKQRRRFWLAGFVSALLIACGGAACSDSTVSDDTKDAGASGASGSAGAAGAGGSSGATPDADGSAGGAAPDADGATPAAVTLDQTGNPVYDLLTVYTTWLSTASDAATKLAQDKTLADNMITWQLPNGGFGKNAAGVYAAPWNGTAPRSEWRGESDIELGTIDNQATATETMFLADVYRRSGDTKYRDSARKALNFLLTMQYPSGGFPQVYPARPAGGTAYSNNVTFNDDAMARVMVLLDQAVKLKPPLDQDIFASDNLDRAKAAIAKGIDYVVNAQIVQNGVKTVWCAQHDPTTYVAKGARSYELPSKSGKESAAVVGLLMTQPQTPEIKAAAQAGIAWFRSDAVKAANTAYVKRPSGNTDDTYNPIQTKSGSTMWYRFYDLDKDVPFFSGRLPSDNPPGMGKKYDIMEIEAERRYNYEWGGSYGSKLLTYSASVGY
jgi:PelA/Pel-15E family pectate lyase